jgi:hypothetical protein
VELTRIGGSVGSRAKRPTLSNLVSNSPVTLSDLLPGSARARYKIAARCRLARKLTEPTILATLGSIHD